MPDESYRQFIIGRLHKRCGWGRRCCGSVATLAIRIFSPGATANQDEIFMVRLNNPLIPFARLITSPTALYRTSRQSRVTRWAFFVWTRVGSWLITASWISVIKRSNKRPFVKSLISSRSRTFPLNLICEWSRPRAMRWNIYLVGFACQKKQASKQTTSNEFIHGTYKLFFGFKHARERILFTNILIFMFDISVHSLPHLTVLSLSGCSKITDDGVELIAENLQKLRALDLSWCPRITDAALEYIACDLNMLEELTLDRFVIRPPNLSTNSFGSRFRCIHITDIGVGYISTMISLNALFLRWCSQIRDFGLQHLCSMRNLQVLSLAGCPLLTSSGLSSIIQLRHLQELELTNCAGASQELFSYLREHLPRCLIIE